MGLKDIISGLSTNSENKIVIGINQIDNLGEWDNKLNLPTDKAEKDIERRAKDIIRKLSAQCPINRNQIEYYSALRAYRLSEVLTKLIKFAKKDSNFGMRDLDPKMLWDKEVSPEMPEDIRNFYTENWKKKQEKAGSYSKFSLLMEEMKSKLSAKERAEFDKAFSQKMAKPPKIGILGKTGVGKTTTVNNLFNANFKTSRSIVGTTNAQYKDFELPGGGTITIVDMPGYGRSIKEDLEYEKIYLQELPHCDIIFLIIQANSRDFVDDQEMLIKIDSWIKEGKILKKI